MNFCTIIAKNYVAHARVLARSLAEHHPGARIWTLVVDEFDRYLDPDREPFLVLTPQQVGCEEFVHMALRYSILELSTAVKPWLLRHLLEATGEPVTYLDPDIKVFGSLSRLDALAERHGVVLTPHNSEPIPLDGRKPSQVDVMIAGVFNLGYVTVAGRKDVASLLDWWAERLRKDCRVDPIWGYFVDQRWFDLAPGFLNDVAIVREPQYNVAYWNLHSRHLERDDSGYRVDGKPLAFFHFSGFDPGQPRILSRHQNRIEVTEGGALGPLLATYAEEVLAEGHATSRHWPYSYGALADGVAVDEFVRELCEEFAAEYEARGERAPSPFLSEGVERFHAWLSEEPSDLSLWGNRLLMRVYEHRPDLRYRFPDPTGADAAALARWAMESGRQEVPLLARVLARNSGSTRTSGIGGETEPRTRAPRMPHVYGTFEARGARGTGGPFGVNVVGHFHLPAELGQVARAVVGALDTVAVDTLPIADWSTPSMDAPVPYATASAGEAPFAINLVCVEPEALPDLLRYAGPSLIPNRYSIGFWTGHMPPTPAACRSYDMVMDELWVPSRYSASLLEGLVQVPINVLPVSAEPELRVEGGVVELDVPKDRFVVACIHDLGQDLDRQNPLGAIDAFSRALGSEASAHLVVGIQNANREPEHLAQLQRACRGRSGVGLVPLGSDGGPASLISVCDCFVSLHRADAVGIGISQAMWSGKPVIATGYGASTDLIASDEGFLVDFQLVARERAGSVRWAEPDVEHAAGLLGRVFEQRADAHAVGERAARAMRSRRSSEVVGEMMRERLRRVHPCTSDAGTSPTRSFETPADLHELRARMDRGPVGRQGGASATSRAVVRKAVLRALKPYTAYQDDLNRRMVRALEAVEHAMTSEIDRIRAEARTDRARLLAELRRRDRKA